MAMRVTTRSAYCGSLSVGIALVALLGTPAAALADPHPPTLNLVWVDVSGALSPVFGAVTEEAEALASRMGARLTWRRGVAGETLVLEHEVTVVLLTANPLRDPTAVDTMGAVLRDASIPKTAWVVLPNVARAVGLSSAVERWSGLERRAIARAVARVICHELVHALAPELPHSPEGLMAAKMGRAQLLGPGIEIQPAVKSAFLASLSGV
jgi:hypothetical protein